MLQSSTNCLLLCIAAFIPHVSSIVQPRVYVKGDLRQRDGSTITITPSKTYDIFCSDTRYAKEWYRVSGQSEKSITRLWTETTSPNVYAFNTRGHVLTLQFRSFQSTHAGEYECRFTSNGYTLTPLSVFLTPTPTPSSKVQGVTVATTIKQSSRALRVSWSAVSGSGITYTVCYSTTSGTQSDPPSNANCDTSGITGTSTTLGPLNRGTTYYIWVAAVSSGGQGPYSDMISAVVQQRIYINNASQGEVDLENGATLTITPSKPYDIVCSDHDSHVKDWYRVRAHGAISISRRGEYKGQTPDVYATTTGSNALTLHFKSFKSADSGEYECRIRLSDALPTLSVFVTPTPPPPPPKVQGVTVTRIVQGSSQTFKVSWSAVSGTGITYTVCYSTTSGTQSDPPSNANCGTSQITGTSTTLGPLRRGTTYYIWVVAVSAARRGPYSDKRQQKTYGYAPPPSTVTATPLSEPGKIRVSWTPATPPTGSTITGYPIQYRIGSSGDYTTATDPGRGSTSTTISGLQLGRTYQVRVGARTEIGVGTNSYRVTQVTTYNYALPPSSVIATPLSVPKRIRVSWTPPTPPTGSTITGYSIQYRIGSSGDYTTAIDPGSGSTSTTISGLQLGRTYQVRVGTRTEIGVAPNHSSIAQTTTYNYAPPPSTVTASPLTEPGKITVSWTPPTPPTGSTITGYSIQYRKVSRLSGEYTPAPDPRKGSSSTTISGLQLSRTYQVRVGARTEIGVTEASYRMAQTTTYNVPGSISELSIQSSETGNNSISLNVTWSAPQSDVPITRYEGNYRTLPSESWSGVFSTPTRQHIYRNLLTGKNYGVRVRAVSAIGNGAYTQATTSLPTITSLRVLNSTSHLKITWTSSGANNIMLHYWTADTPTKNTISNLSSPYNITNLESNTHYKMQLIAQNEEGTTKSPVFHGSTTPEDPTPIDISTLSSTSIKVQWTPPPNSDRLPLTYHVNYTEMSSSTTSTTLTLTGLHPYEEYTISVQAGNRAGLSVPVTGTARTYSDKPSSPPTMRGHTKIASRWCLVSWRIPKKNGRNGIITHYIIELNNTNSTVCNVTHERKHPTFSSPVNVTCNLTNLTPHTFYYWKVAAATVNGTGPYNPSPKPLRTHQDVPGPVTRLGYNVISSDSVNITWSVPMEPNGVIKGYNVSYREIEGNASKEFEFNLRPHDFHKVIKDLKIYTPYEVIVTAKTTVGAGVPSLQVVFSEQGVPTKPVENVVASRVDSRRVNISWTPLSYVEARGIPLYTVFYMSDSGVTKRVNTYESSVIIPELGPHRTYMFTIQVSTGKGTGEPTAEVTLPGDEPATEGGGATSAVAAAVAVLLIVVIAAIVAICIVVCFRRRRKAVPGASAMIPVHCEKKEGNEYSLGIDSGGKGDVASILGELPVMADCGQKIITRKSFLAATKQLHLNRDRGFEEEFKTIVNDPNGSEVIAKANRRKNRYGNITTYDHCRVVLSVPDENGSDYINASYINGYVIENVYIASQGPTPNTVSDFWQMLWDQKCPVIVMLTKVEEKGKKKCHQYWEDELLKPYEPGRGLEVTVTSVKGYANYEVREITLSNPSSGRTKPHKLKQFHYTGWPDHGVPTHPSSLVKFAQQVRREYKDSTAPLLVHCSAGVGRTGTFITIDAMLERLQEKDNLNIYEFVTAMRTRRTFMVQTMEQYAFIHDALCDYLMCGDTSVAAHELRMEIQSLYQADAKTRKSRFQQQFELLDSVSKKPVSEDESFSRKAAVVKKNRYKDKFPYSNCYVRVPGKGPTGGADYMNASYIDSYSRNKAFIAAQAPLESTKNDVWEMIWQYRPSTVVVLCDFQKERQEACSRFWPDEREKTLNVGFLKVNNGCTERDTTYDITRLEVFDSRKESSKVLHVSLFHLKDWDKEGLPTTEAVLRLMGDVQNTTASPSGDVIPAVVMCDDGMGRSGVFICAMSEVERVKVEGQVDVFQTIKGMRIQRPHMVETADQYKLCFEILQSYLDSFDTYANFKAV